MKYFKNGWENKKNSDRIMKEYDEYYQSIEQQLSDRVKKAIDRHDDHIVKMYFEDKDYIMELEEKIWGKGKIVFSNANIRHNADKQDIYWLYEEIYKVQDKLEIHISFHKSKKFSDIIVLCDDVYVRIEEKEYFKKIYNSKRYNIICDEKINNKKDSLIYNDEIIHNVIDKENFSGMNMLNTWEKLIFSFYQIYMQAKCYKYNNIDELIINHYYNYSNKEKEEIYIQLFKNLEKNIIDNISILREYNNVIKNIDLKYVIEQLQLVYNKKDILIQEKNTLYLNLNEKLIDIDFDKIYEKILEYINNELIK